MGEDYPPAVKETIGNIREVIERHGPLARGDAAAEDVARAWLAAGFADSEDVDDWLRARCFKPDVARALEEAGITPEQAGLRTSAGAGTYEDTIGYKLTRGDLSLDEARRLITSHFWNS